MSELEKDLRDFVDFAIFWNYISTVDYKLETTQDLIEVSRMLLRNYTFTTYFTENTEICEDFFKVTGHKPYLSLARYNKKITNEFFEREIYYNGKSLSPRIIGEFIRNKRVSEEFIKNNMDLFPPEVWDKVYE